MPTPPSSGQPVAPPPAFQPTADASWIWSLAARDPEQAAQRLAEHDAIHLQAGTALRLRERWLIVDPERVFRRACMLVGIRSAETNGDPPPEDRLLGWFHECIDDAAQDCLDADEVAHRDGLLFAEDISHYRFFNQTCMVIPENTLFVSLNFNCLPDEARQTFFALFIDHRTVEEALEMGLGPEDRLRANAIRSVDAAAGINPRAPSWRDAEDGTIGPWWAQEGAFENTPDHY